MIARPLVSVRNLSKVYAGSRTLLGRVNDAVRAVDDVTFDVFPGETLALVGESGCGKTTTGRALLRLIEPTSGDVHFDDINIRTLDPAPLRRLRRHMQVVFQDPYGSLDPRMTVRQIISEGMEVHGLASGAEADARVARLLDEVGLRPTDAARRPHEFSGGQRQRIAIARALAVEPKFIVLDEAVSALDVTVQAQIVSLLMSLQREHALTYLFISHNLAVVEHVAHNIAVMYLGRIVEYADKKTLFTSPQHPYTESLLAAVPVRSRQLATCMEHRTIRTHRRCCRPSPFPIRACGDDASC